MIQILEGHIKNSSNIITTPCSPQNASGMHFPTKYTHQVLNMSKCLLTCCHLKKNWKMIKNGSKDHNLTQNPKNILKELKIWKKILPKKLTFHSHYGLIQIHHGEIEFTHQGEFAFTKCKLIGSLCPILIKIHWIATRILQEFFCQKYQNFNLGILIHTI